jgi:hypothetical protein
MWDRILELLPVGCRHRHMSLPFSNSSARKKSSDSWETTSNESSRPYVVCLDCGKHFDYDWANMRVVK